MTTRHNLKTDPAAFQAAFDWRKNFEIRKNDRGFAVGDDLVLEETQFTGEEMRGGAPLIYTQRRIMRTVTFMLSGPIYGLVDGWVILSWSWK